jgi:chemotaxis protein CheX
MQVEYVNPFIVGAVEVFREVANIDLKKAGVSLKESPIPSNEIALVMGVRGFLEGQVVYSFKTHTAERVVSAMMPNTSEDVRREYQESAVATLANMITGRATIMLAGAQHILSVTPPYVVVGKDAAKFEFVQCKTISALFSSRFGTMEVNVALVAAKHFEDKHVHFTF